MRDLFVYGRYCADVHKEILRGAPDDVHRELPFLGLSHHVIT